MRKILLTFLICILSFGARAEDVTITWSNEGIGLTVFYGMFQMIQSGDKVPAGTTIKFAANCGEGIQFDSFLVNGVDRYDELLQDINPGESEPNEIDYLGQMVVNEDTHIQCIGSKRSYSVLATAKGNGSIEIYQGSTEFLSGDKFKFGESVTIKCVPGDGESVKSFTINGMDYSEYLLMGGYKLGVEVDRALKVKVVYTGEDGENALCAVRSITQGNGEIVIETLDGEVVNDGDKLPNGTEVKITAIPENDNILQRIYINGDVYIGRFTENGNSYTLPINSILIVDATFKDLANGGGDKPGEHTMWLEVAASSYASGKGTAENPYVIKTPEQFAKLANDVIKGVDTNGVYYELGGDIDLDGLLWYPIGFNSKVVAESKPFCGVFDGKDYEIKNIDGAPGSGLTTNGLFGTIAYPAEVRNVNLASGYVYGSSLVGAIVGYNRGGLIENCVNHATVEATDFYAGGITSGNANTPDGKQTAVVRNCVNYGSVSSVMSAAGICGSSYGTIDRCVNHADILATQGNAGGIVAAMESGILTNCYNRGAIEGSDQIGGVVGAVYGRYGDCEIYSSYSAAERNGNYDSEFYGGVVGDVIMADVRYVLTTNALYCDSDLYDAPVFGNEDQFELFDFDFGTYASVRTEEMRSDTMVDLLNLGEDEDVAWFADTKNVNDGYPVLEKQDLSVGSALSDSDDLLIKVTDNTLAVEGCDANSDVEIFNIDGRLVVKTKIKALGNVTLEKGAYIVRVMDISRKFIVR